MPHHGKVDERKLRHDLLADNSHGETHDMPGLRIVGIDREEGKRRGLTKIAGGVMFDTPSDQPSTARSSPRGRAVAASRSPTSKLMRRGKKREP